MKHVRNPGTIQQKRVRRTPRIANLNSAIAKRRFQAQPRSAGYVLKLLVILAILRGVLQHAVSMVPCATRKLIQRFGGATHLRLLSETLEASVKHLCLTCKCQDQPHVQVPHCVSAHKSSVQRRAYTFTASNPETVSSLHFLRHTGRGIPKESPYSSINVTPLCAKTAQPLAGL